MKRLWLILMFAVLAAGGYGESVSGFVNGLEVGDPVELGSLTLFPLRYDRLWMDYQILTMDQAISSGALSIREQEDETVSWVIMTNRGAKHILVMGGEIITGCKQDRLIRRDVLISPYRKRAKVPVYCVESGRWTSETDVFYSKKNVASLNLRSLAQDEKVDNQMNVWQEVDRIQKTYGVSSKTEALQDVFDDEKMNKRMEDLMQRYESLFSHDVQAAGFLVSRGNEVISLDCFGSRQIFLELWPKMLKSLVISSEGGSESPALTREEALRFVRSLAGRKVNREKPIDGGSDFVFTSGEYTGRYHVYKDMPVHLAVLKEVSPVFHEDERNQIRQYRNSE